MRNTILKRVEQLEKALVKSDLKRGVSDMTDEELMFIITGERGATLTDEQLHEIAYNGNL